SELGPGLETHSATDSRDRRFAVQLVRCKPDPVRDPGVRDSERGISGRAESLLRLVGPAPLCDERSWSEPRRSPRQQAMAAAGERRRRSWPTEDEVDTMSCS